jgi:hypothetical protein
MRQAEDETHRSRPSQNAAGHDGFQTHPQQRLREQGAQGDDQDTAICAMYQPRLQRKLTVKLAKATKKLFSFDPVGGNHFALCGKTAIGLRRFESNIMPRDTILAAKNSVVSGCNWRMASPRSVKYSASSGALSSMKEMLPTGLTPAPAHNANAVAYR